MSEKRTCGYIVTDNRQPMVMDDTDRVLWLGSTATPFRTRRQARAAIARTLSYAKKHSLPWGNDYRVWRLEQPRD